MKIVMKQPVSPFYYTLPIIIAVITWLVYIPSLHYSFQFDDLANITKYFNIRHHTLWSLFFSGTRWISYWLNTVHYGIGKFDPFSYRIGNVIIHTVNGLLIFCMIDRSLSLLSRIKKQPALNDYSFFIALLTASFFLLHPVQTQTVSYVIQGELEGLAVLFTTITSTLFLIYCQSTNHLYKQFIAVSIALISFLSCGTKEITIVLPCLLLLLDWFFVAQGRIESIKSRKWLHVSIFTIIYSTYLYFLKLQFFYDLFSLNMSVKNNIGNVITAHPQAHITPYPFFISQFKVIVHYLMIFFWPFNISVEYDWTLCRTIYSPDFILPFFAIVILFGAILRSLKKNRTSLFAFGMIWFFICILPRSSIMPSPELIADYKTYLASIGLFFVMARFFIKIFLYLERSFSPSITEEKSYILKTSCLFVLCTFLGYATHERNKVWHSGPEFWADIIKNAPNKARAYNNYGFELSQNSGSYIEAIPYFKKAIALDKQYPDPCNNLAVAYARTGDMDKAIEAIKKSLAINPYYPEGYNNLASFFLQKKDYLQAKKALEVALKIRPYYGKALYNLGKIYSIEGHNEKAWECYKSACLKGDLDTEDGFTVYAHASLELKKYDDALAGYMQALKLNPLSPTTLFGLGNVQFLQGKNNEAIHWYTKALALEPANARIAYGLAEAHFNEHQLNTARTYYEKVCALTTSLPQALLRLAECHSRLGNKAKVKEYLDKAQARNMPAHIRLAAQAAQDTDGKMKTIII